MRNTLRLLLNIAGLHLPVLLLSACGLHELTGYGHGETFTGAADERVLFRTQAKVSKNAPFRNEPPYITCAEPSPDIARLVSESSAMRLSASVGLPGNIDPAVAYGLARGHAEGMAQLTDRLATTQILRDALYRACEAYANGAIDRIGYSLVLAHSERVMFGLLMAELISGRKAKPLTQIGVNTSDAATLMQATMSMYDSDVAAAGVAADHAEAQFAQRLPQASKSLAATIRHLRNGGDTAERTRVNELISRLSASDRPLALKLLGEVDDEAGALRRREAVRNVFQAFGARPAPAVDGGHALPRAGKGKAAPSPSPAVPAPAPAISDSASSELVELARIQALQELVSNLVQHPTLDGIEVACIAGAQASKVPNAAAIQQLCTAALADIAVTKIVANHGDARNLTGLRVQPVSAPKP